MGHAEVLAGAKATHAEHGAGTGGEMLTVAGAQTACGRRGMGQKA